MSKTCSNCFNILEDSYNVCPKCGQVVNRIKQESNALAEGTLLNGKYLIGKVLGEGGFGITYLAWDQYLKTQIAIKEFFPNNMVIRNTNNKTTVQMLSVSQRDDFASGLKRYINEATILSKLFNLPGIVTVKDFFYENETAYIVMEYINGISLKEYLRRKGGIVPWEEALAIIEPIISSLDIIHQNKMLHRDISPDNIMITNEGVVKLIDFGAARYFEDNTERSMTVVLKHGYAPLEQYSRNGAQGSWTDVYALCAVLYRMLTGHVPVEAVDRAANQPLVPIRNYQKKVPRYIAQIIERGLAVNIEDRWQTMSQFHTELYASKEERKRKKKSRLYSFFRKVMVLLIVFLVILIGFGIFLIKNQNWKVKYEDYELRVAEIYDYEQNNAEKIEKDSKEEKKSEEYVEEPETNVEASVSAISEPVNNAMEEEISEEEMAPLHRDIEAIRNNVVAVESELDHSIVVARDGILNGINGEITVGTILNMFSDSEGAWTSLEDESGQIYVYYVGTKNGDSFSIEFSVYSNDTFKITGAALNGEKIQDHSGFFQSILDEVGV